MKKIFGIRGFAAVFIAAMMIMSGDIVLAEDIAAPVAAQEMHEEFSTVESTEAVAAEEAPTEAIIEEVTQTTEEQPGMEEITTGAVTETELSTELSDEEEIADEPETAPEIIEEMEDETEENYLTDFFFENDEVEISAFVSEEAKLPQTAVMNARKLEEGSEEFEEAKQLSMRDLGTAEDAQYVFYDVTFCVDGNEVELPEHAATVSLRFKNIQSGDQVKSQSALHIESTPEGKVAQDVTGTVEENSINSIDFTF